MAHKLSKHYSDFGGIDTRSNQMAQNPSTFRDGSKNWRHTLQDELAKRYGFQHKTALGAGCELGLMEYKYRDINTGQSKSQVLGVSDAGVLSKLDRKRLKLSVTAASTVVYYSLYYNGTNYVFVVYDTNQAALGTITLTLTTDLDSLVTSIGALSITGLSASVVDTDNAASSSSEYAYHLDCVYMEKFNKTATDVEYNDLHYWTAINTPDGGAAFPSAVSYMDDPQWEGMSSVNLNNVIYITDGGFPMKYDGYSCYRAGMPKQLPGLSSTVSHAGHSVTLATTGSSGFTNGVHYFRWQLKYRDPNGSVIYGKASPATNTILNITTDGSHTQGIFGVKEIVQNAQFPIYSCKLNGAKTIATGSGTSDITVDSGHNIKVGMALRIWTGGGPYNLMYFEVTSLPDATTIRITKLDTTTIGAISIADNTVINGCYCPTNVFNQYVSDAPTDEADLYGTSLVVYCTQANTSRTSTYYRVMQFAVPRIAAEQYTYQHGLSDASLTYALTDGEDLPRACKYLGKWQGQLTQGGRPYNYALTDAYYPTYYDTTLAVNYNPDFINPLLYYTETGVCDFQSIYWADSDLFEGFPQSGLNEESFERNFNDSITGFYEQKEALFVFKDRTTAYLTGSLATGDIVKEYLEGDIGSVNMNSICEVRGAVMFMDQYTGFWAVTAGRLPEHIGWPVSNQFQLNEFSSRDNFLRFKRAVACNYRLDNQYICYIPAGKKETDEGGVIPDATTSSKFFVFDYSETKGGYRAKWDIWQDVHASGGILSTADDYLLIAQKSSTDSRLWKQKRSGSKYDYSDHTTAIAWLVKSANLNMGLPLIDKDWHKVWLASIQGDFDIIIQQYGNYIDTILSSFTLSMLVASSTKKSIKNYVNCNKEKLSALSIGLYNNTINQDIRLQGWELEYSTDYDSGEAKK